jgi:solute carrier family 25 protein 38
MSSLEKPAPPAKARVSSNFLAGSLASVATALLIQPFDVLKTSILVDTAHNRITQSMKFVYSEYGISGFWKGITPSLARACIGGGLSFTALEFFKSHFHAQENAMQFTSDGKSAACARFVTIFCLCPLTVIKVRMEAPVSHTYHSIPHAFRTIMSEEGLRGFYTGLVPNLMRDIPYSAIAFGFYTQYKNLLGSFIEGDQPFIVKFGAGLMSGFTATMITQPFDVVKTRLQYAHLNTDQSLRYSGLLQAMLNIWKNEGLRGFSRGISLRLMEKSLSYGFVFSFYESFKNFIQ